MRSQKELDLLDGYAAHPTENYVLRYGEAIDIISLIKREARAEGWDEAHECDYVIESKCKQFHPNPYREDSL